MKPDTPMKNETTANCMTLQNEWVKELLDQATTNMAGKSYTHNTFEASEMVEVCEAYLGIERTLNKLLDDRNAAVERFKQAEQRLAEAEKAAKRYGFLRERPSFIGWDWWNPPIADNANITPEFMDSAIDAALAQSEKKKKP